MACKRTESGRKGEVEDEGKERRDTTIYNMTPRLSCSITSRCFGKWASAHSWKHGRLFSGRIPELEWAAESRAYKSVGCFHVWVWVFFVAETTEQLLNSAHTLLMILYDRDCRRSFTPPHHWLVRSVCMALTEQTSEINFGIASVLHCCTFTISRVILSQSKANPIGAFACFFCALLCYFYLLCVMIGSLIWFLASVVPWLN